MGFIYSVLPFMATGDYYGDFVFTNENNVTVYQVLAYYYFKGSSMRKF
jgi:hypothetical protein